MTPDDIRAIKILLDSNKPRDAALVREILKVLKVPEDDIERLTGRLSIIVSHEVKGRCFASPGPSISNSRS